MSDSAVYRALRPIGRRVKAAARAFNDPPNVPPGHYHSPLQGKSERRDSASAIRERDVVLALPDVDMRSERQLDLLTRFGSHAARFPWHELPGSDPALRYSYGNEWYHHGDGAVYAALLMEMRPSRVIEVGSGYSSALLLDVDERFLGGSTTISFIEPFPDRLRSLVSPADLQGRLQQTSMQQVPIERFRELGANDVLFIDSTHVSRPDSDVNYLFFDVLPSLRSGVLVHLHDIHWPFEYPAEWVEAAWSWTETYLARAFLAYNADFEVFFMNSYLREVYPEDVERDFPLLAKPGPSPAGSLWLRRR